MAKKNNTKAATNGNPPADTKAKAPEAPDTTAAPGTAGSDEEVTTHAHGPDGSVIEYTLKGGKVISAVLKGGKATCPTCLRTLPKAKELSPEEKAKLQARLAKRQEKLQANLLEETARIKALLAKANEKAAAAGLKTIDIDAVMAAAAAVPPADDTNATESDAAANG